MLTAAKIAAASGSGSGRSSSEIRELHIRVYV